MPDDAGVIERFTHKTEDRPAADQGQTALKALPPNATDEEARRVFLEKGLGRRALLELSKCNDFVVNRGHYFGTDHLKKAENEPGLSDEDKRALIEFLQNLLGVMNE